MKIVLTGPLGSGKSTVVRRVMGQMGWRQPAGFRTRRDSAARPAPALILETWRGDSRVFGRLHGDRADPETPPYDVDLEVFNQLAAESLETTDECTPVVVDELGILELDAAVFIAAVSGLFQRAGPVLAVIQERALERWREIIEPKNIDRVFRVESGNRDRLPEDIVALLNP